MIYLIKNEVERTLDNLKIKDEIQLETYPDNVMFTIDETPTILFPATHKGLNEAIDQIIMTGHYLYGKNESFRKKYLELYEGHEFNINYRTLNDGRQILTKNLFNLFLYGIVTSSYIKDMTDKPYHYMARPVYDEKNPSLEQFIKNERLTNKSYRKTDGTPFYNYILKKTFVLPSNNNECDDICICPISRIIPEMKNISANLNRLAVCVFKKLINSSIEEDVKFCKSFIDESWSPYLKCN